MDSRLKTCNNEKKRFRSVKYMSRIPILDPVCDSKIAGETSFQALRGLFKHRNVFFGSYSK